MSLISITVYSKVDFIYEVMKTSLLKVKVKSLSIGLFATPWTVAHQAPLSMGFSRQESWSGLPFPSPGDLSNPGIEPKSPTLQADSLPAEPQTIHFVVYLKLTQHCKSTSIKKNFLRMKIIIID